MKKSLCYILSLLLLSSLVACGSNTFGECNVSGFHNVAAVSAGERFTLITFKDGSSTVVGNFDAGQSNP